MNKRTYHNKNSRLILPSTLLLRSDKTVFLALLLTVWDITAVFVSGYIGVVIYKLFVTNPAVLPDTHGQFLAIALRTSALGSVLAPMIFRQETTGQFLSETSAMIGRVALQVVVLFGLLLAIGFLTRTLIQIPRIWVVLWLGMIFVSIVGGRVLLLHLSTGSSVRRLMRERIAVVGETPDTDVLIACLHDAHGQDIEIVGPFAYAVATDTARPALSHQGIAALLEQAKHHPLDRVVLALPSIDKTRLDPAVRQLKALNVDIVLYANAFNAGTLARRVGHLDGPLMTTIVNRPISKWGLVLKALEDQILSTVLILCLLPVMALIAIAIKLDSPGPIFFRQRRHGLNNTEFDIFKFRTMMIDGAADTQLRQTQRNDARVTRVGRFLRRSSLDEVPQLLNVLRGEMSLVGPRPHPVVMRTENRLGEEIVDNYAHRHRVKPGLTGWAQINGYRGPTSTMEQVQRRIEHDLLYIDNWSILLDLKILALTPLRLILDGDAAF